MNEPWICPKCGRVYSPSWPECYVCNNYAAPITGLEECLVCGGYHPKGMACPKYIATNATKEPT